MAYFLAKQAHKVYQNLDKNDEICPTSDHKYEIINEQPCQNP